MQDDSRPLYCHPLSAKEIAYLSLMDSLLNQLTSDLGLRSMVYFFKTVDKSQLKSQINIRVEYEFIESCMKSKRTNERSDRC